MAEAGGLQYWQMPFPPGWERKWDATTSKYFYVNHQTHGTQWEDPRIAIAKQIQAYIARGFSYQDAYKNTIEFGRHQLQHLQQQKAANNRQQPSPATSRHQHGQHATETSVQQHNSGHHHQHHQHHSHVESQSSGHHERSPARHHSPARQEANQLASSQSYHPKPAQNLVAAVQTAQRHQSPGAQRASASTGYGMQTNDTSLLQLDNVWASTNGHDNTEEVSSSPETSFIHVDESLLKTMKTMYPTCPDTFLRKVLTKCNNDRDAVFTEIITSGYQAKVDNPQGHDPATSRLKREFPTADESVIQDIYATCGSVESQARRMLREMFPVSTDGTVAHSATENNTAATRRRLEELGYSSAEQQASNSNQQTQQNIVHQPSPIPEATQRTPTPPKPQISEMEKKRLLEKLKQQFSSVSKTVVEMALEASEYDEERSKVFLQSISSPVETRRFPRQTNSSSPAPQSSSATQQPRSVSTSSDSNETDPTSVNAVDVSFDTTETRPSTATSISTILSRDSHSSVTDTIRDRGKKTRPAYEIHVSSLKPVSTGEYTSGLRTTANGPAASLAKGPNVDLLIDSYAVACGHQANLARGPNKDLVRGPSRAVGHDSTLAKGHNPDFYEGPVQDLVKGSHSMRAD